MKIAAFDIGGTSLKMGVITDKGQIVNQSKTDVKQYCGDAILNAILGWTARHPECEGIALSVPGYVNPETGFVTMGGAISDFDNFDLQNWLSRKTGLPVTVENDANCALLAEHWLGQASGMSSFLMMTVGTGVGGAIFCNGSLLRGHRFRAGEFGWMLNERPGSRPVVDYTMNKICTLSILRSRYAAYKGVCPEEITGEDIFNEIDLGNKICERLVNQFYQDLCSGIHNLYHIFDPECIFIGGGVTERPKFILDIRKNLSWYGISIRIEVAQAGNSAGMLGAVRHFTKKA